MRPCVGQPLHRGVAGEHVDALTRRPAGGEPRRLPVDRQGHRWNGGSVPEASVDAAFGRQQRGQRNAAGGQVVELATHHRREQPRTAMAGAHAHRRDTGAAQLTTARNCHRERIGGGGADDLIAVEHAVGPVQVGEAAVRVQVLVVDLHAELPADRVRPRRVLVAGDRAQLEA